MPGHFMVGGQMFDDLGTKAIISEKRIAATENKTRFDQMGIGIEHRYYAICAMCAMRADQLIGILNPISMPMLKFGNNHFLIQLYIQE
jgi:hypothetical protein